MQISRTTPLFSASLSIATLILSTDFAAAAIGRQPDFNGDGYADLVMPAPGEKIGSDKAAGAVNVIYGGAQKLTDVGNQFWHQDVSGIAESTGKNDEFGGALAWGDFNADNYADLVVSAPGENSGAGAVHVIYGSAAGLASGGSQIWRQGSGGVIGSPG